VQLAACRVVSRKTCRGRFSLNRTLPLVYSPALGAVTPSHRRCVNYIGCQFRDEWSSSLPVLCTSHWHQRRRRTSLSTFDSSLSMVVVLCVDLPTVASPGVRGRGHCISNIRVGRQNRLVMCGPPSTTPAAGKFSQRICHVLRVQFGDSCVWVGSNCLRLPPPVGTPLPSNRTLAVPRKHRFLASCRLWYERLCDLICLSRNCTTH